MERLFLFANIANYVVQLAAVLAVTLAAFRWGGAGARAGAIVNAVIWPWTTVAGLMPIPAPFDVWIGITLDLLAGAGFLYTAVRFNSLWIGVSVVAQGVQMAIDVVYLGEAATFDRVHHFMIGAADNVFTYVIQIAILGAALADRRRLALEGPVRV